MPVLPPNSVFPNNYDTDNTLYMVYNTTESVITQVLNIADSQIFIKPVEANEDEIWAENGFANISGELIYYGSVLKNGNDKVYKLTNCIRNLGGRPPQYNSANTDIRSFVMAEHHNQLARGLVNTENFIGITNSTDKSTVDWRIRYLINQPNITDDFGCPEVNFIFIILSEDPLFGTTIEFELEILGVYDNFILEFGDGTSTITDLTGTHVYPPNSTIDPTVTVNSSSCQTVNSDVSRTFASETLVQVLPQDLTVVIDSIPEIPPIVVDFEPNIAADITLPPIVFPCLDIGPFGPISIPSTIVLDPPVVIPSTITFNNVPIIPSTISVSPFSIVVSGDRYIDLVCIPVAGTKGFFVAGANSSNQAIDLATKITYSNDVVVGVPSANITGSARFGAAACADGTAGYIAGGYTSQAVTSFYKTIFETETTVTSTSVLSQPRYYLTAVSGENKKGYYAGGLAGSSVSTVVDVIEFSTGSMSVLTLPTGRARFAAVSLEAQKGYFCGGITGAAASNITDILVYSTSTWSSATSAYLKSSRTAMCGIDGNTLQGYFAGGSTNLTSTILKSIEKMNYSWDQTTVLSPAVLATGRSLPGGVGDRSSRGYIAGGLTGSASATVVTSIEKLSCVGDTISSMPGVLGSARCAMACFSQVFVDSSGGGTTPDGTDTGGGGTDGGGTDGGGTGGGGTGGGGNGGGGTGPTCGTCTWVAYQIGQSKGTPPVPIWDWKATNNCTSGCACTGKPAETFSRTKPADVITNCASGFAMTGNGYMPPQESYGVPTPQNFVASDQGYASIEERNSYFNEQKNKEIFTEPTPEIKVQENDFAKSVQQAFKSVKVRIKDEDLLPNIKDLLGD